MKRIWSDSQKEVIYANDARILVSASAGSGKTTVMIERILRLIGEGAKLANMLVCTFTKASAADMRAKLYAEMSKRGYKSELKELSRADISTIDSFCQRVVSKYFYVLGVDPQFEVLDEGESAAMKKDAVEKAISRSVSDEDFELLCYILRSKRRNYRLSEAISGIMEYRSINPDSVPSYNYDAEDVKRRIDEYMSRYKQRIKDRVERLFEVTDEKETEAELLSALENGEPSWERRNLAHPELKPCVDYLKGAVKEYCQTLGGLDELRPQYESEHFIKALIKAADLACKEYENEKSKRSAVDFADLENMTLRILRSDAGEEISKKYKYVFVDEYQDINPLQEAILSIVAKGNNLFMVGDLKQSIYAFRGCAPYIFKQKYDEYIGTGSGKVINLDVNYRSAKKVVSFVNDVFRDLMTEDFGGVDYGANPMTAFSPEEGYVKIHLITGKETPPELKGVYSVRDNKDTSMLRNEAEATLIAYRVQNLLEEGVSPGDIAILTRSMGSLEDLVIEKLKQINLSVSLKEDVRYIDAPVTGQLINFLRLIDNRRDDKAMAVSMLSPFGGFGENELARIRMSADGNFFECVQSSDDEKVKDFLNVLDRYGELSRKKNVDELADMIVSEFGYFNYAFKLGGGAPEVLDKFLEFLNACPFKSTLRSTLKFIDEHDPHAELVGDENSVKLMTVHKSKGLEFDHVFLIGLGESFNLKELSRPVFVESDICMNVYEDHAAYESDLKFLKRVEKKKKLLEEELRIFYVALTRAKFGLELFGALTESNHAVAAYEAQPAKIVALSECNSFISWLAPMLIEADKRDIGEISVEEAEPRKVFIGEADETLVKSLTDYFDFAPTAKAPIKSYVSKIAHSDDEPATFITPEPSEGSAVERGNAYHRAMERIDFFSPDLSAIDPADMALIDRDKLLGAAQKMKRFKGKMFKEKPFMLNIDAAEAGLDGAGKVLVQGVIDLLVIDGDEAVIVDYKTGAAHGPFESGYIKQVDLYAKAAQRLLNKRIAGKYLYYFDSELFVEIE